MKKLTKEQVLNKFQKTHKNKYDYSLVEFNNNKSIIIIICPIHGKFNQRLDSHYKYGCSKCSYDNKKSTFNDFIYKSNIVHDKKYDYVESEFIDLKTKTKIICPVHGIFEQIPNHHLSGRGCKECKKDKIGNLKRNNINYFINNSNKIHNNKYDYFLVEYKNNKTKIKIICPIHGIFEQRPDDHIRGVGCLKCKSSIGEIEIKKYLEKYKISYEYQKYLKGCANKRLLPFDFYLPDYNIAIEYDGIQHHKPLKFFGGEKEFIKTQKRDKIKDEYCKENNIHLLRIKYNENIYEKLNQLFSHYEK